LTYDAVNDIFDIVANAADIGPLLLEARARAGLSQRALAERAHTTQAVVARIESGTSAPSFETLRRLLDAAGFELKVEVVTRPDPDPVIEAFKRDVDQTLLVENLRRTPAQRAQALEAMARLSAEMGRARRVAGRKR
jgi:transcriptional regulator with XRE-family HTH domain